MPFYFYKSWNVQLDNIVYKYRMHFNENTIAYLNTFQWKHNNILVCLHHKAIISLHLPFL